MEYKIKQIKNYNDCEYIFDWWKLAQDKFNLEKDYETVYEGELEVEDETDTVGILEKLFFIFNMKHPQDFKGHSLSVSDVVELNGKNYYCDSNGWVDVETGREL